MKRTTKLWICVVILCLAGTFKVRAKNQILLRSGQAQVVSFDENWRFARYGLQADGTYKKEPSGIFQPSTDDSDWEILDVPHDFAIKGPFRMDLAGNTGRLPFQGIGWYLKAKKKH